MDISKCTIKINASVIDALEKTNEFPSTSTIFVEDRDKKIIGTLTDGDIRKGIINGLKLNDDLEMFIFKTFSSIIEHEENLSKLKEFRER